MILITKTGVLCVCVFIKLHITAQSGSVILVILSTRIDPPKGGSMIRITETSDQARQGVCVCVYAHPRVSLQIKPRTETLTMAVSPHRSVPEALKPCRCRYLPSFARVRNATGYLPLG